MVVEKPEIVGITESWISTDTIDFEGEYQIPGYKLIKRDRTNKKGGGVLLYVKECLDPIDCELLTEHEMIGVVLKNLKRELYFYLVYRPPHQAVEWDESLYNNLSTAARNKFCIITGDFNCPKVNWKNMTGDAEGTRLLDFASEEILTQWVEEPTRGNNILDLVFSSEDNLISNLEVGEKLGKSDHSIIRFEIKANFSKKKKSCMKPNFRKADFEKLRSEVRKIERNTDDDAETKWNSLKIKYMSVRSNCIPQRNAGADKHEQPKWFNKDIAKKIGERQKAYYQSKLIPTEENIKKHKQQCRNVDKSIKKAKLENEHKVAAAAKSNPKVFYAHANSRKPIKNSIGPLKDAHDNIISSDEGMADLLNEYFASVYTEEDLQNMPAISTFYQGNEPLQKINLTLERVQEKIKKLNANKSPGPDEFYPREIKEIENELAPHFYDVYRASLDEKKAVLDWKLQNVAPLFKKGSKDKPENHRPVSLTSVPGKILESIIAEDIMEHLESNNLISNSQHGFRRGRSCLTNLLEFFHDMFSMYDKSRAIDILYLDFQKAFDKVPHKRLMAKVRSHGIIGEVADWIEDWLTGRKQRVVINGSASPWRDVTSGVPQGSVLGPLLFIIYINDLDQGLLSRISKFADDTKVGINAKDVSEIKQGQDDLKKIGKWSQDWQMPFNLEKCKVMHVGQGNSKERYELLGKELKTCDEEKDLGVVITSDLKSSRQCIEAEKKAQKVLGYIKRQFTTRKAETILTLYRALVRPHLEYAVQFWSPALRKDVERLEKVQARATKLIPNIRHISYERRLTQLNLYSLEKRRIRGQLIETFKMLKGIENIDYRNLFTLSSNQTRSNGWKLDLKRFNTTQCGTFFTYKVPTYWNKLPAEVVNSTTINQFKNKLDRIIDTIL